MSRVNGRRISPEPSASMASKKKRLKKPKCGTSAKTIHGITIGGNVFVRLKIPRSRPRRSGRGRTRNVCAECIARYTELAKPNTAYANIAKSKFGAKPMQRRPKAETAAQIARGDNGRPRRSDQRPATKASGAAMIYSMLKTFAVLLSFMAGSIDWNQKYK